MVKKSMGYLLRFVLVLAVSTILVPTASVWSSTEECIHTQEHWEQVNRERKAEIESITKDYLPIRGGASSRMLGAGGMVSSIHNDPALAPLAHPNWSNMSAAEQNAWRDAHIALDYQAQFDPEGTPLKPGGNSLRRARQRYEAIPDLERQIRETEAYIKRCFGGAYVEVSVSEGEYIAYNCSGLEGRWDFEIKRSFPEDTNGMGTFTVPPQPDEQEGAGRWLTPPFSFSLYGEAVQGDCDVIVIIEHTNAVMEIVVEQEFRSLNFTGMGDVEEFRTYNCPEGTYDISSPGSGYLPFAGEIIMDRHSRCP